MTQFHTIRLEEQDLVVRVVLARPQKRNAFNSEMIAELTGAFCAIKDGRIGAQARVVLLSGEGSSFCSGADVTYMQSVAGYSRAENKADADRLFAMFTEVQLCPLPVLAHVHGHAMGGGVGLIACADIALAETGTEFAFSEVRLGIIPAVISPFVLNRLQPGLARRWMLSGEVFDADQALLGGLVSFVGSSELVMNEKKRLIRQFCEVGPGAVKEMKRLICDGAGRGPSEVRDLVTDAIAERRASPEGQEGLRAFLERRDPNFKRGVKL